MHCVTSSTFSVLWNGNKLPPFKPTHGLRQGDPLSPYIFILCMEKLSLAINNAVLQGEWEPIRMSASSPPLSHLLFADDVLLFTKAKNSQLRFIKDLFDHFSQASGLKINISKSRAFYSPGVRHQKINNLTSISGIRSTTSLGKYLGFPILNGRPKRSDFHFIIEKMQSRLASWKNKLLNKAGRLTLASSVVASIPTYYMQINWLPQSICAKIDQTTRNFIWKGANDKGVHLVGWKKIALPKYLGGLGIRSAREANICLLGKLVWDLFHNNKKLWVSLFSAKYVAGPNLLNASIKSSSSPTWSSIIRAKNILISGYSWRPGSGTSSFWFSTWSNFGPLGSLAPIIDIHDLHLTVKDVIYNHQRSLMLYTPLPQAVTEFINNINFRFHDDIEDAFIWPHNKNGIYSTKSGYQWLISHNGTNIDSHSWSWIWRKKIPEKYKFFIWLACHNSLPTLSLLHHRQIAASATCSRCGDFEETIFHCIRDCSFSSVIWHHIGFSDPSFFAVSDMEDWIKNGLNSNQGSLFAAGLWWIWRSRNAQCFNNETISLHRLASQIYNSVEDINFCFHQLQPATHLDRHVRWNNNNFNCTILNVDGSCIGSPIRAGFGGLFRNSAGLYLSGFSGFIPTSSDVLQAELTAIHYGITMAIDKGIYELAIYSDSMLSINILTGNSSSFHIHVVLIQEIRDMLSQASFSLHHTLREGNQCADYFAKLGASSDSDIMIHQSPPDDLRPLLRNDASGTLYLRA